MSDNLDIRVVPMQISKEQVQIQGEWFDCELIEALIEAGRSYGFESGTIIISELATSGQLHELERRGLAFKSAKGSWHGTRALTLINGVMERFG